MSTLKLNSEWWTSPAESDSGNLVMVTGRRGMERVIATGKYNDRVEINWKYKPDASGMPDLSTASLMEKVQEAIEAAFRKDPVAVLTGIYTGDGERNWVLYTLNLRIFEKKLNEALSQFELLPITLYAEKDPEWNEYKEMKEQTEIMEGD